MRATAAISLVVALVGATLLLSQATARGRSERVSRPGAYRGYSEPTHDGYVRRSEYLDLSDGSRLAFDLLLPIRDGGPTDEALPVLLVHTPYLRVLKIVEDGRVLGTELFEPSWIEETFLWLRAKLVEDGHLLDQVFRKSWLGNLIEHGYAVVAVERRGTGASSGVVHPSFEVSAREANEILDWIAAQPWSDGRIGMVGDSYEAMTQYAAASTGNPHLKAIFPCSAGFDFYDGLLYPGGIYNKGFASMLPRATAVLEKLVVPVDSDTEGRVLARHFERRRKRTLGKASSDAFRAAPFRDSRRETGPKLWDELSLYRLLDQINRSGVPVYASAGWYDIFTRDAFLWHANLTAPRRLLVRSLHHSEVATSGPDLDYGIEAHRWFDYWLKGIDNGIMDEPPIHYHVIGAPRERAWRTSDRWPLPSQRLIPFFLAVGRSGSVASTNDGFLRRRRPDVSDGADSYSVDYSTTSGYDSRWNAELGSGVYADMRQNDERGLTYTTPPLEEDLEVTGHPVAHLWLASDAPDIDLFVYLEAVDGRGRSTYVTEGALRASHRRIGEAPFDNLALPFQRSHESDVSPLTGGEPVELVFDLLPTARLFARGSRIRLTVTGADADNFETPQREPVPQIRLLRDAKYASYVALPVIPGLDE